MQHRQVEIAQAAAHKVLDQMPHQHFTHPWPRAQRKNGINQPLFLGPGPEVGLNPYASILVEEAYKRGRRQSPG